MFCLFKCLIGRVVCNTDAVYSRYMEAYRRTVLPRTDNAAHFSS